MVAQSRSFVPVGKDFVILKYSENDQEMARLFLSVPVLRVIVVAQEDYFADCAFLQKSALRD